MITLAEPSLTFSAGRKWVFDDDFKEETIVNDFISYVNAVYLDFYMMSASDKILKIYMKICLTIRYTFASFWFQVPSLKYEKGQNWSIRSWLKIFDDIAKSIRCNYRIRTMKNQSLQRSLQIKDRKLQQRTLNFQTWSLIHGQVNFWR